MDRFKKDTKNAEEEKKKRKRYDGTRWSVIENQTSETNATPNWKKKKTKDNQQTKEARFLCS